MVQLVNQQHWDDGIEFWTWSHWMSVPPLTTYWYNLYWDSIQYNLLVTTRYDVLANKIGYVSRLSVLLLLLALLWSGHHLKAQSSQTREAKQGKAWFVLGWETLQQTVKEKWCRVWIQILYLQLLPFSEHFTLCSIWKCWKMPVPFDWFESSLSLRSAVREEEEDGLRGANPHIRASSCWKCVFVEGEVWLGGLLCLHSEIYTPPVTNMMQRENRLWK